MAQEIVIVGEKEAASYVGLSVKTLQARRFRREEPKYIKMGRCVRYRIDDLNFFIAAHTVDPSRAA